MIRFSIHIKHRPESRISTPYFHVESLFVTQCRAADVMMELASNDPLFVEVCENCASMTWGLKIDGIELRFRLTEDLCIKPVVGESPELAPNRVEETVRGLIDRLLIEMTVPDARSAA